MAEVTFERTSKVEVTSSVYDACDDADELALCRVVYELGRPTASQSAFVSVVMGAMTGAFGIWMGGENKDIRMKYNTSHFLDKLIAHEGMVLTVYQDTLGIDTIGIGRNLKDRGISKEELDYMDIPSMDAVYEHGISEADARYLCHERHEDCRG